MSTGFMRALARSGECQRIGLLTKVLTCVHLTTRLSTEKAMGRGHVARSRQARSFQTNGHITDESCLISWHHRVAASRCRANGPRLRCDFEQTSSDP